MGAYIKHCDEVCDWVNNVEDVELKYKIVNLCDLGDSHGQTDPKMKSKCTNDWDFNEEWCTLYL